MSPPHNKNGAVIRRTVSPTSASELEKLFCFKVGGMPWKRVVEGKKHAHRLGSWNSSAAEKAFRDAKRRFWQETNGLRPTVRLPSPDLFIDDVDWNAKVDPELLWGLEAARGYEYEDDDDLKNMGTRNVCTIQPWMLLELDQIKATGWDVVEELPYRRSLEGMVVGD